MRTWRRYCAGLVLLAGLASGARAQVTGIPGTAAPAAAAPPGVGAPAAPAAGGAGGAGNLWSYLCLTPAQKQACKDKFCSLPLVQLLGNAMAPLSAMSGGIVGGCCPGPNQANPADLAKPPDSAEGAAARVKADEADAPKRRAAVRYMSTADCHRWPEVQDALIAALRLDRNECVRWEAALAFTRGCCCTKPVIRALTLTVSGSTDDGAPAETSERVKAAAHAALDHCLGCYVEVEVVPPPPPPPVGKEGPGKEGPPPPPPPGPGVSKGLHGTAPRLTFEEYYHRVELLSREQVVAEARRVREHLTPVSGAVALPPGQQSVFGLMQTAIAPRAAGPATAAPPPAAEHSQAAEHAQAAPKKSSPGLFALLLGGFSSKKEGQPTASTTTVVSVGPSSVTTVPEAKAPVVPATAPASGTAPAAVPIPVVQTTSPGATSAPPASSWRPAASGVNQTSYAQPAPPRASGPKEGPRTTPTPPVIPAVNTTTTPAPAPAPKPATLPPPQQTTTVIPRPQQLLAVLREAARVEHRVWAADVLGSYDGWTHPQVVQGLVQAARDDKSPVVRAICARNLGRMNVRTLPVLSAVQALKSDPDATVRDEAEKALRQLGTEPVASLPPGQRGR